MILHHSIYQLAWTMELKMIVIGYYDSFIILFWGERKKLILKTEGDLLSPGSLLRSPAKLGQEPGMSSVFPVWVTGIQVLEPSFASQPQLEQERHSNMRCGYPKQCLNCCVTCLSLYRSFFLSLALKVFVDSVTISISPSLP